jgi:hypothetical protein
MCIQLASILIQNCGREYNFPFLKYRWHSGKFINEQGLPNMYEEMYKYLTVYEETVSHI